MLRPNTQSAPLTNGPGPLVNGAGPLINCISGCPLTNGAEPITNLVRCANIKSDAWCFIFKKPKLMQKSTLLVCVWTSWQQLFFVVLTSICNTLFLIWSERYSLIGCLAPNLFWNKWINEMNKWRFEKCISERQAGADPGICYSGSTPYGRPWNRGCNSLEPWNPCENKRMSEKQPPPLICHW